MPRDVLSGQVLLADIGGTHARFCLAEDDRYGTISTFATGDFEGPEPAIRHVLNEMKAAPRGAVLACAGPVTDGRVRLTNSGWVIDADRLRGALALERVVVANDFEAIAWSIPSLERDDLFAVGGGAPVTMAPAVALGPGTGLGVAAYLPDQAVVVGEGGHATMAATSDREAAVLSALRLHFGHVSVERVLSGDGLELLYRTLARLDERSVPARDAAEITAAALDGSCAHARGTLDLFCDMLGSVAGDLALTFGARGGIYIAGGIVPRFTEFLKASGFRKRFEAKGRFESYVAAIPIWVVRHPEPAFLGLMNLRRQL